jgi:predicted signal transduction protein with EAL and GGDEF domain
MGQNAAQPLIDMRDKIVDASEKFLDWGKATPKKGPPPPAKQLGWADQTGMRKAADDPKLGSAKKKATPATRKAPAKKRQ